MKARVVFAVLISCGLFLAATPCAQADDYDYDSEIVTQGAATLFYAPDQVRVNLGVETRAQTASRALQMNAQSMQGVLTAVKKKLAPRDNVSTSGVRLSPVYSWDQKSKKQVFLGFKAINQVRVISADTENVGALLDASVESGANTINGPYWSLKDDASALSQAQVAAFENARNQARALARAADRKLGEVESISTVGRTIQPTRAYNMPSPRMAEGAQTQVLPGRIEIRAEVTCVFELE